MSIQMVWSNIQEDANVGREISGRFKLKTRQLEYQHIYPFFTTETIKNRGPNVPPNEHFLPGC